MKKLLFIILTIAAGTSCVSTKTYNSARAETIKLEGELNSAKIRGDELSARNEKLGKQIESLSADTTRLGGQYRSLDDRYKKLLEDGSAEAARMLRQLEKSQSELAAHSERVNELEQMLKARDEAIDKIRRKVADALIGFDGKGLSISTRDGKVYVSMDDKLLFRSGSFDIEPKGAEAIKELGTVLAQNPDINIMVEGHTDNVPYKPNGNLRDNLDLSAKRATTVTRLLLENKEITPERIVSAGRGESVPVSVEDTSEARARNRRTEIILSPKLDELMHLLDR